MGYSHIPRQFADPINAFYFSTFNPWLNLHRPCLYATESMNAKGKITKRYLHEDMRTPLAKLMELAADGRVKMKEGVSLASLYAKALSQTDLAAAQKMQVANAALFASFETKRAQPKQA